MSHVSTASTNIGGNSSSTNHLAYSTVGIFLHSDDQGLEQIRANSTSILDVNVNQSRTPSPIAIDSRASTMLKRQLITDLDDLGEDHLHGNESVDSMKRSKVYDAIDSPVSNAEKHSDAKDANSDTNDEEIKVISSHPPPGSIIKIDDDDYALDEEDDGRHYVLFSSDEESNSDHDTDNQGIDFVRDNYNEEDNVYPHDWSSNITFENSLPANLNVQEDDFDTNLARIIQDQEMTLATRNQMEADRIATLTQYYLALIEEDDNYDYSSNSLNSSDDENSIDMSYESLLRLEEDLGEVKKRNLSEQSIALLQRHSFNQCLFKFADTIVPCAICMGDYVEEDLVIALDCKHYFHDQCLEGWLRIKASCPVCRMLVLEQVDD